MTTNESKLSTIWETRQNGGFLGLIRDNKESANGMGNNPMVGATVAVAVSVEEAANNGGF